MFAKKQKAAEEAAAAEEAKANANVDQFEESHPVEQND